MGAAITVATASLGSGKSSFLAEKAAASRLARCRPSRGFCRSAAGQDGDSGLGQHSAIPASFSVLSNGNAQLPSLCCKIGLVVLLSLVSGFQLPPLPRHFCWGGHIQVSTFSVQSLLPALLKTLCRIAQSPAGFVFVLVMWLPVELAISAGTR